MIRATVGILAGVGGGFDADYQAVLDYATAQGYTLPSASQQALQNQLVVDLKDNSIWSKLDTFAVFATDGDIDFALIDWKRLTQYTAFNSPTFTANEGFQGDGSSSYMSSNYIPNTDAVNYSINSASFGYYCRIIDTAPGVNESIFAALSSNSSNNIIRYTRRRLEVNSTTHTSWVNFNWGSNQFVSANRTSSSNINIYLNGSITDNLTNTASTVLSDFAFDVLKNGANYSNAQVSMTYAGADLSSEQSDFYTAFYTNYLSNL